MGFRFSINPAKEQKYFLRFPSCYFLKCVCWGGGYLCKIILGSFTQERCTVASDSSIYSKLGDVQLSDLSSYEVENNSPLAGIKENLPATCLSI